MELEEPEVVVPSSNFSTKKPKIPGEGQEVTPQCD
jgi:hypothetical protein